MDRMGIWFENFALPVVINECLMQSYKGTIRLFPNWPIQKDAEFHHLRAAGAFLVSASLKDGMVSKIEILSEAGSTLKMKLPWEACIMKNQEGEQEINASTIELKTQKFENLIFKPKN